VSGNKRILLDTNAVILLLRDGEPVLTLLNDVNWVGISILTKIEFLAYTKLSPKSRTEFNKFLSKVTVIPVVESEHDEQIHLIIELRKKYKLKLPDCIIAAAALQNKASLITADKAFKKIESLKVLSI
jgi:predicted nucleic acid-binding protein